MLVCLVLEIRNSPRWRASPCRKLPRHTQLRYAEIRALVGGVTALQGASDVARTPDSEPLVRNVDQWIFGQHRARAMIDLPSTSGRDVPRLQKILADITAGDVDAFYLHLCEGVRADQRSATEFQRFLHFQAATPATIVIHASALDTFPRSCAVILSALP